MAQSVRTSLLELAIGLWEKKHINWINITLYNDDVNKQYSSQRLANANIFKG